MFRSPAIVACVCALTPAPGMAAYDVVVPADDSGWYNQDGRRNASTNYFTGWVASGDSFYHRSFFVFTLPTLAPGERFVDAELRLLNPKYLSNDPTETFRVVDVTTPVEQLVSSTLPIPAIFDDLGGGTIYGETVVAAVDEGEIVVVNLNGDAVAAINAAPAGSRFAVGGLLTTIDQDTGIGEYIFGNSGSPFQVTKELVLTVPEPSTFVFCGVVTALAAGSRRSRR